MTFKHTNFEDSPTMRSLEKLAKEKGLIKTNPLEKIASKPAKPQKVDLKPTSSLTENLMRLCAGLREEGMDKYAEELEATFMMYKKASAECDSDMVQEAHPKGSHKLEGVEGDAVIETIIDQHLANMKVVDKKPTGKLTSANGIINAVKVSLAEISEAPAIQQAGKEYMKKAFQSILNAVELTKTVNRFGPVGGNTLVQINEFMKLLDAGVSIDDARLAEFNAIIHNIRSSSNGMRETMLSIERGDLSAPMRLANKEQKDVWYRAISLVDMGISYSYAANKVFAENNPNAASWHAAFIPTADVAQELNNHLIHPLQGLQFKIKELEYEQKKDKLDASTRQQYDNFIQELAKASTDSIALRDLFKNTTQFRIVHPREIDKYVDQNSPLKDVFAGINSKQNLVSKCIEFTNTYRVGVSNLEGWLKRIQ